MNGLSNKIKELRKRAGINQTEFAKRCNLIDKRKSTWGQSRIGNYEQGIRVPNIEDVRVMSIALNVDPAVLAFENNVSKTLENTYYYPVLNDVQAGLWTGIEDWSKDEGFEMLASPIKASPNSFYLRIKGDSMLDKFKHGDIILVDPEVSPTPGRFVVAINEHDETTFKKYKEIAEIAENGAPHFELVPLNDMYPTLSSKMQKIRILGVVVGSFSAV